MTEVYILLVAIYICGLFAMLLWGGASDTRIPLKTVAMGVCWPLTLVWFVLYVIFVAVKNGLRG